MSLLVACGAFHDVVGVSLVCTGGGVFATSVAFGWRFTVSSSMSVLTAVSAGYVSVSVEWGFDTISSTY